jgi:hypothetical protein
VSDVQDDRTDPGRPAHVADLRRRAGERADPDTGIADVCHGVQRSLRVGGQQVADGVQVHADAARRDSPPALGIGIAGRGPAGETGRPGGSDRGSTEHPQDRPPRKPSHLVHSTKVP